MRVITLSLAVAALAAGHAAGAGTKTVKDWTGVCSNVGECAVFGFSEEGADLDSYVKITRGAGGAAAPEAQLVFDAGDRQSAQSWTLAVDGRKIAGVGALKAKGGEAGARASLDGPAAAALVAALKDGEALEIMRQGKRVAAISLAGSAAILLWADDQQGRVGTLTAWIRSGPKPASAVPPPAAPPAVTAAPAAPQTGLPETAPRSLIAEVSDCDPESLPPKGDDIVARLGPGLVLWGPECQLAAYNEVTVFFLGDEHASNLKRLSFPEPPGAAQASDDLLMNASFDPKTRTLSSFSKGRGLGDCGDEEKWAWTGRDFQLVSKITMPECRGVLPQDWAPIYVADLRPSG